MKIITSYIPEITIEEFADKNNLVMQVGERATHVTSGSRYYARFVGAEVKDGIMLNGVSGSGMTPKQAIDDYARRISLETLVVDAYTKNRREIKTPRLVRKEEK